MALSGARDAESRYNGLRKKIILADLELFVLYSALCAKHGKQLAEQLDPALGKQLVVLEFDFYPR